MTTEDPFTALLASKAAVVVPNLERPGPLPAASILVSRDWFDNRCKERLSEGISLPFDEHPCCPFCEKPALVNSEGHMACSDPSCKGRKGWTFNPFRSRFEPIP